MTPYSFQKSMDMFQRAAEVIPGGISGQKNPVFAIPGNFPYFATHGEGCRYWDVDGNEYIDYLCGYGPIVLGHNYPAVEEAANERRKMGYCFNHPTELTITLAEKMVNTISIADWAVFGRNGSDVTTYCVQVAREYTQRRKIIMAKGAYHGSHAWSSPGHGGLLEEDVRHIHEFTYNDAQSLADLVKELDGDVAGVILTPYHHPAWKPSELPKPGFMDDVQRICKENGIVLICDDVRAGFRLHPNGSHEYFGFKPDLSCFSKAIANGYSISSAVGTKEMKAAASKIFFTGSFYTCATEYAAALACIDAMEKMNAIDKMMKVGKMLQDGLVKLAEKHGLDVIMSGPPTIPFMMFNEPNLMRMQRFSTETIKRGIMLHPHHNWFVTTAHEESDIEKTLDVCDEAFAIVKKEFGS